MAIISLLKRVSWSTTHIGGECVLKLADRIGHRHWGRARRQAEIGVFGADAKLNGGHGQHGVHVEVNAVDGRDGAALESVHSLRAFAMLQRALVSNGTWFVLFFRLLRTCVRVLGGKRREMRSCLCVMRLKLRWHHSHDCCFLVV